MSRRLGPPDRARQRRRAAPLTRAG
jgi:hypothetical protein